MRPLPIYFAEPFHSVFGTMLFPDDAGKAERFVARLLAQGPVRRLECSLGDLERTARHSIMEAAAAADPTDQNIEERRTQGQGVGEIVKVLWADICSDSNRAGWNGAISFVEAEMGTVTGSRALFRKHLKTFAPVVHLWGAWSIREGRFTMPASYDADDGTVIDDLWRFASEAELLRLELQKWLNSRPAHIQRQDRTLSVIPFSIGERPWTGELHPSAALPRLKRLPGDPMGSAGLSKAN